MATNILGFIQFDDNSSRGEAAFTSEASYGSLCGNAGPFIATERAFNGHLTKVFSRPFGTYTTLNTIPILKDWAIVIYPFGMERAGSVISACWCID
jgi:hypothetical protein